ncbi:MAG TPA: hypothetical protein VGN19_01705 [Pedococcus sp.]|jgi:hypothetical protein|nr:hypothetical protein [Pedococcus sp.]
MNTTRRHTRWVPALGVALAFSTLVALPAAARPDPGPKPTTNQQATTSEGYCPLERIGRQLIRCDNLTGNGVSAPLWVPER